MPTFSSSLPAVQLPSWLTNCLGFVPGSDRQEFDFDGYQADEFDHLLSADPGSRSFLSRLPFKRGSNRQLRRAVTEDSATDESLRSLLIDDRDAELFGEDSINMLLTTNNVDMSESDLPLGHRSTEGPDDFELLQEEEALRIAEEQTIERNRERARRLAVERGLSKAETRSTTSQKSSVSTSTRSRSARSASVKSQMSMIQIPGSEVIPDENVNGILPHMRPS